MKIAFRADASHVLGTGHVLRCLSLATRARRQGHEVLFICRKIPGHLGAWIRQQRFPIQWLPLRTTTAHAEQLDAHWAADAEGTKTILQTWGEPHTAWLVIDHYGLDARWHVRVRSNGERMMAIDDLGNRRLACAVVLNQNAGATASLYAKKVNRQTRLLLGPRFALLRSEFQAAHRRPPQVRASVKRLALFMGGADPKNETLRILKALSDLIQRMGIHVDVLSGFSNAKLAVLKAFCESITWATFHKPSSQIQSLLKKADLAIGAGGVSALERCCLGLPSLVIAIAPNQIKSAQQLAQRGALSFCGTSNPSYRCALQTHFLALTSSFRKRQVMARKAWNLLDGNGCQRVMEVLSHHA